MLERFAWAMQREGIAVIAFKALFVDLPPWVWVPLAGAIVVFVYLMARSRHNH
jgi:hypothetical protein